MATLYKYLKPVDNLPNPSGPLSIAVCPAVIKEANEAVRSASKNGSRRRGHYAKFTPEQQAAIGKYASINGNQAAIRHFSEKLGVELKVTTVQTWKGKYRSEISRKRKAGEEGDITVKSLPVKKRGRPLLLGEKLDSQVRSYIQTVRHIFDKFSIIDSEVLLRSRFNQCFAHARVRNLKLRNFF